METTPTPSPTPKLDAFNAMKEQILADPNFLPNNLLQLCIEAMVETMPELDQKRVNLLFHCATLMQGLAHHPQQMAVYTSSILYEKTLTKNFPEGAASWLLANLVINEKTAPR